MGTYLAMLRSPGLVGAACEAYIYGLPAVLLDETFRASMAVTGPLAGKTNRFTHLERTPGPDFRAVVRPNVDTLYSSAFLDLSAGPVRLELPPIEGRYVLFALIDAWTNNFAEVREAPTEQRWFIVGPGFEGKVPSGYTLLRSPTPTVWIIGRTEILPSDEVTSDGTNLTIRALQQAYRLTAKEVAPRPHRGALAPPPQTVAALSGEAFVQRLHEIIHREGVPATDARKVALVERLATAGDAEAAQTGVALARRLLQRGATFTSRRKGWGPAHDTPLGDYGNAYLVRAVVAMIGFGANRQDLAVYKNTATDGRGRELHGAHHYRLTFSEPPPVDAFWSLTVYDEDGYLVANAPEIYAVGSHDALPRDPGTGAMTVVMSREGDGPGWLPIPDAPFAVTLRMYAPRPSILDGSWQPPAIERL